MEKKLKAILIVLLMVLIILIGFGGIYTKELVLFKNILPDYEIGSNLEGVILTTLVVDDTSEEVIYDKDGNKVDEIPEGEDKSTYTKEQVPINNEEIKTTENYKISKDIMVDRLKSLGVSDYEVRFDEQNGDLAISLKDTNTAGTILGYLLEPGEFEIIDSDSKDVLMTNGDIKESSVLYQQTDSGIAVYLDIQFNDEGTEKLKQISNDYKTLEEDELKSDDNGEETEATEEKEEVKQKTITMNIDDGEFLSTSFDEVIENGRITISVGTPTTDTDNLNDFMEQAQHYATMLNNGKMPVAYKVESSEYVPATFANDSYKNIAVITIAALVAISILYIIIRYKKLGIYSSIIYIATIALFLILIRYTRREIAIENFATSLILVFINTYINCKVLNKLSKDDTLEERTLKVNQGYLKALDIIIIVSIPAIILTYNTLASLASIGMFLFWGITAIVLMNGLFTRKLLLIGTKK